MKHLIPLALLTVLSLNINAQNFSFGLSGNIHFALYQFKDTEKQKLTNAGFSAPVTTNPALGLYANYEANKKFLLRLTATGYPQKIRISENIQSENQLDICFNIIELGLTGRFAIPLSDKMTLTPYTGISLGLHKPSGAKYRSRGATPVSAEISNEVAQGNSFTSQSPFLQAAALLGFTFGKTNGKVELDIHGAYGTIEYPKEGGEVPISTTDEPLILNGKFHHISIGINYNFGKK